jgi:hypothetical protein
VKRRRRRRRRQPRDAVGSFGIKSAPTPVSMRGGGNNGKEDTRGLQEKISNTKDVKEGKPDRSAQVLLLQIRIASFKDFCFFPLA